MNGIKKYARVILPDQILTFLKIPYTYLKKNKIRKVFRCMYKLDMDRYLFHSRTLGTDSHVKMIGAICLQYHVIEKGLTMPDTRLGFGSERVITLCKACGNYISKFGQDDEQLNHAVGVILEYEKYHHLNGYKLGNEVEVQIDKLKNQLIRDVKCTTQQLTDKESYFKHVNGSFSEFSTSRSSVRNFSKADLPISRITDALELARKTPSACNRQSWRTYVFSDRQIISKLLEEQAGNKGFGHLANKLIIISGELGGFCYTNERYQVYIDGGMYAMNLLYALHFYQVAACILNCSFDYEKEQEIKSIAGIKETEVLIAMIVCGEAAEQFKIALSYRYGISRTNIYKS